MINLQWSAKEMSLLLSEKKKVWNFIWWKNIWHLEKENGDLKNQMKNFFKNCLVPKISSESVTSAYSCQKFAINKELSNFEYV